jgi:hypothetical protein
MTFGLVRGISEAPCRGDASECRRRAFESLPQSNRIRNAGGRRSSAGARGEGCPCPPRRSDRTTKADLHGGRVAPNENPFVQLWAGHAYDARAFRSRQCPCHSRQSRRPGTESAAASAQRQMKRDASNPEQRPQYRPETQRHEGANWMIHPGLANAARPALLPMAAAVPWPRKPAASEQADRIRTPARARYSADGPGPGETAQASTQVQTGMAAAGKERIN